MLIGKIINREKFGRGSNRKYKAFVKATKQGLWNWKEDAECLKHASRKIAKLPTVKGQSSITEWRFGIGFIVKKRPRSGVHSFKKKLHSHAKIK